MGEDNQSATIFASEPQRGRIRLSCGPAISSQLARRISMAFTRDSVVVLDFGMSPAWQRDKGLPL